MRWEHFGSLGASLGIFNSIQLIFFLPTYFYLTQTNVFSFLYVPLGFQLSALHFRIIAALQYVVQVLLLARCILCMCKVRFGNKPLNIAFACFFFSNYHIHKWAMKNCKLENWEIRESYKYIDLPIPKQWQLLNLKSLRVRPRSNFSSNYLHLNKLHTMRMKQVIIEQRKCWFVNKLLSWRPSCKKFDVCSYAQGDTPDFKWQEWSKNFVGVWNFQFQEFFG